MANALLFTDEIETPLGWLVIEGTGESIVRIAFQEEPSDTLRPNGITSLAVTQLSAYFEHRSRTFSLPLAAAGTAFQQSVWKELMAVPFGETRSYEQIAQRLGGSEKSRAVGLANGKNPIAIVIPCHRIIGINGSLTGYAGGLMRKRWLIDFESDQQYFRF